MEDIPMDRAIALGCLMEKIAEALNDMSEGEMEEIIQMSISQEVNLVLCGPKGYRKKIKEMKQGRQVFIGLLEFKRKVKGLGFFK